MDLNHLLERHQLSLMRAAAAGCVEARHAHQGLADGYGRRVRALQAVSGGHALAPAPRSQREALACRAR